jgi:FecR-like protein
MKKAGAFLQVLLIGGIVAAGYVNAQAQGREKFVISAKAGGINAVTGRSVHHGKGTAEWQQLTIKDNLEAGDVVKTSIDGRVEMLLNPGSYMRVAENTEFELVNNSVENLEVRLIRGTAIVEATGADDTEMLINITTPHARMAIVRRGLYRVNVVPGDATELMVKKGRVLLEDSQTIKGGKKLRFSGGNLFVAKMDKTDKEKDNFDVWSKQRAETVAQANRRISSRDRKTLIASFNDSWSSVYLTRSAGIWFFNSGANCYTFLPFYLGWGSPYGSSYARTLYDGYNCCGRSIYGRPSIYGIYGTQVGNNGSSSGSGNPTPPSPAPPISAPRAPTTYGIGERMREKIGRENP